MKSHVREFPLSLGQAQEAISLAAEAWGAEWVPDSPRSGQLRLPILAGLRRGVLYGRLSLTPIPTGCRVSWELERSDLRIHRPSFSLLALTAAFVLPVSAWPLYPPLLGLLPLAGVMGFLAWFLVLSRLQSSGPEEFFSTIAEPDSWQSTTPPND